METTSLQEMLRSRDLPPFCGRQHAIATLLREEYGILPEKAVTRTVSAPTVLDARLCAGQAALSRVDVTLSSDLGAHTFPVYRLLHEDGKKHPFFVFLNIQHGAPTLYFPVEEIADAGFDVLCVCYTDLSSDDGDFTNGLAGLFYDGPRGEHDAGKLMLWAYGASRILDMAAELPMLDLSRAAVMGHSRLGKTALLAGMLDERFRFVFSNDSGCSGAALSRGNLGQTGALGPYGKTGESIRYITETFPFWFAPCYARFADTNAPEGFDQHHLLAAIAPRYAYVASADMDDWADPDSEFLSCVAASVAWERLGLSGFVHSSRLPKTGEAYQVGHVGYHRRHGKHFLSRHDWAYYMSFIRLHEEDAPAPQPAL